jgi:SpoVK/Ycf46/Vps4 family AAA+-type ATPase
LLHGGAGVGKTLASQYIASELRLPLLKVDCSQVLGMFVGESEKQVKRIFDEYEEISEAFNITPVLLLNEADQLLGERNTAHSAVDKMNNNMQNLFLEGLERFKGILIATTNRKDMLDEAFSRRFTYKLELHAPDKSLRKMMWVTHIPKKICDGSVNFDELSNLALTGGEIRLVLEQAVRSASFQGLTKLNNTLLMQIAKAESNMNSDKNEKVYGFRM